MTILHHDGASVKPSGVQLASDYANLYGHPIIVTGSKVSGFYKPERREYYRKIQGSKHFNRKPAGIANDLAALAEVERLGADRCRIVDSETGCEYTCIIAVIRDYGTYINRGWGEQLVLPFAYWIRTAPDGTVTPPTLPKPQAAPVAEQPALFDYAEPVRKGGAY